jgi:predicted phage terminase large subunit-like protein
VFKDAVLFDPLALPKAGLRVAVGVDLAYSAKTHADWSSAVALCEYEGTFYVLDVIRGQDEPAAFGARLKAMLERYSAVGYWYGSTTEKGTAALLTELGAPVQWANATADKFARAQPVAAAWNAGLVQVAMGASWAHTFVTEVAGFTGVKDRHDDQVDALAAAFDALKRYGSADDDDSEGVMVHRRSRW